MNIGIINDTHFGIKNGAEVMLNYQRKFFDDVFFPYCVKNEIDTILHLGDFFDHRKFINFKVLNHAYDCFISKLEEHNMSMHIVPGNHDTYYKNSNDLNALSQLLKHYKQITVVENPVDIEFDGLNIGFLPWICTENHNDCMKFIANSKSDILVSHLELSGFEMIKGLTTSSHGLDKGLFSKYEMVLSGHYHTKSTQDNIHYLGTQFELTWSDSCDPKYFHVLNTNTRELKAIRNENTLFNKVFYSDKKIPDIKKDNLRGTYVKIVAVEKKDLYAFDKFVDRVQSCEPYELKIVESYDEFVGENVEDDVDFVDTQTLLNSYVDAVETDLDKDRIKNLLQELYVEASNIGQI